jgi:hypothetical protein
MLFMKQYFNRYNLKLYAYFISIWVWNLVFHINGRSYIDRAIRGIFWPKKDEVTTGWRKSRNEELRNFFSLINIIKSKAVPLHAMEVLGGRGCIALHIYDLGTRWGEWSASRPGRALPPAKGQEAG